MTNERLDDHLWLEEVEGDDALDWVRTQNTRSLAELEAHEVYDGFEAAALEVLTSKERIPYGSIRDGSVFNFWQDDEHVRGIWRRSEFEAYVAGEPVWKTVLDFDALAISEDQNWVFAGASVCRVDGKATDRYLVTLSIGGQDASTVREYDIGTGEFISPADGGFFLPESKQSVSWTDLDTLLIATDWGEGSMTESGYPNSVRRLRRGDSIENAEELFTGEVTDVGIWPMHLRRANGDLVSGAVQRNTFFTGQHWLFLDGGAVALPIPPKADIAGMFEDQVLVTLSEDWEPTPGQSFASGDLVAFDLGSFIESRTLPPVTLLFHPTDRQALQSLAISPSRLLLSYSDNVVSQLMWAERSQAGEWSTKPLELPGTGEVGIAFSDSREDAIVLSYQDYLTPDSQFLLTPSTNDAPRLIQGLMPKFDASNLSVTQRFSTSADGTQIPYFLVHRSDITPDGSTPTLLYGYGGFEISLTPSYSATIGRLWLERGGAYAVANIRGGGEFGPAWHQAGLKQKRQVVYDDFISVAEDLIATGVTAPERLGIMGGSNGGLLMGVMITQRPELWNAVVIQVPLLDMLRYHLLLAGASWVDEYGSPDDPDERAFLETLSPYHRFDPDAEYPVPFFVTSTKDDRVHPGHARKMAKRFEDAGQEFLYFENIDGGHGAATNQLERAKRIALEFTYLTSRLFSE